MQEVIFARLTKSIHIPGVGQISLPALPPENKKLTELKMHLLDNGYLNMQWTDKGIPRNFSIGPSFVESVDHTTSPKINNINTPVLKVSTVNPITTVPTPASA